MKKLTERIAVARTLRDFRVLNLGAGVQSTTLYIKFALNHFDGDKYPSPHVAIFADTQDEPHWVYEHLDWLEKNFGDRLPIIRVTKGCLSTHLSTGQNSTGQRFASIPAFTISSKGKKGRTRRQCSKEYKVVAIEQGIRYQVVGLQKRQPLPKDANVTQYIGMSLEEGGRANRLRKRYAKKPRWLVDFPLIGLGWTRGSCETFLRGIVPHEVRRSACKECPYHSDAEWHQLAQDLTEWPQVLAIDDGLRIPGRVVNRKMNQQLFLHSSCIPLREIDFPALIEKRRVEQEEAARIRGLQGQLAGMEFNQFTEECEGVCGF